MIVCGNFNLAHKFSGTQNSCKFCKLTLLQNLFNDVKIKIEIHVHVFDHNLDLLLLVLY